MSDQDALLGAIWDAPNDDTPRLVYADWLDENGDPDRAEFIRVQCELARLDEGSPKRSELGERESRIWNRCHGAFKRGLRRRLRNESFHRGFVRPRFDLLDWRGTLSDLLRKGYLNDAPLCELSRSVDHADLTLLTGHPSLRRVERLELGPDTLHPLRLLRSLASSPYAENVTILSLARDQYEPLAVPAFDHSPAAQYLTHLSMRVCSLGDDAIALWAETSVSKRLKTFNVRANRFGIRGATTLLDPTRFPSLQRLDISGCSGGDDLVGTLVSGPMHPNLRILELDGTGLTDAGCEQLAGWPGLARLDRLSLVNDDITLTGLRALAKSPHVRQNIFARIPGEVSVREFGELNAALGNRALREQVR